MKKLLFTGILCLISFSAMAANNTLPNGKPFQNLQDQINVINMTIAEQKVIYDAKFAALAAKDNQHDELIGAITVALNLVTARVGQNEGDIEALQLADSLHDRLIQELTRRLTDLESSTSTEFSILYEQDRLINQIMGALDTRLTSLRNSYDATANLVNDLNNEITSYRYRLFALNNLLSSFCSSSEVLTGIYGNGDPRCEEIEQLGTIYTKSTLLYQTSFCDSEVAGFCVDTDYYEYGYATCAYGYVATGGGSAVGGTWDQGNSRYYMISRPHNDNSWYVQSIDHGDDNYGGFAFVRCLKTQ